MLDEAVAFAEPRAWTPKKGAIKFCNVAPEAGPGQPQDTPWDHSSIEVVPGSDKKKKDKKNKNKDKSAKGKKKSKKANKDKTNKKKNKNRKSNGSSSHKAARKKGSACASSSKHRTTPAEAEDEGAE